MESFVLLAFACVYYVEAMFCGSTKVPLEIGVFKHGYAHMDSTVVENKPVTISEGQFYVYENDFPNHIIKYIHVDNLAMKTCGAKAMLKSGGVGTSTVLIILHAATNQEIRTVVDIWGVKISDPVRITKPPLPKDKLKNMKSLYLFKDFRTVNHNGAMISLT